MMSLEPHSLAGRMLVLLLMEDIEHREVSMCVHEKLDSQARYLLSRIEAGEHEATERVNLLLQVTPDFSPVQRAQLEADGLHIRTEAGDVLTADGPIEALERVDRHDFVRAIQVSGPLYTEASQENEHSRPTFYSDVE